MISLINNNNNVTITKNINTNSINKYKKFINKELLKYIRYIRIKI